MQEGEKDRLTKIVYGIPCSLVGIYDFPVIPRKCLQTF